MNEDTELSLVLKVGEINTILNTLSKPVEGINELIKKIKQQGESQITKINEQLSGVDTDQEPE